MTPAGDKVRVTARISKELDTKLHHHYTNLAPAIVEALELLLSTKENKQSPEWHQQDIIGTGDNRGRIGDLQKQIEFLKEQLAVKDSQLEKQAYSLQSLIQVNSALNMKLLPETPTVQKEEIKPASEEPENTNLDLKVKGRKEKGKKGIQMTCLSCGGIFEAQRSSRKYCTPRCKTAYERKKSREKEA